MRMQRAVNRISLFLTAIIAVTRFLSFMSCFDAFMILGAGEISIFTVCRASLLGDTYISSKISFQLSPYFTCSQQLAHVDYFRGSAPDISPFSYRSHDARALFYFDAQEYFLLLRCALSSAKAGRAAHIDAELHGWPASLFASFFYRHHGHYHADNTSSYASPLICSHSSRA